MANPIDLSVSPEERTARRFREIEEDNGYAVRARKAGGAGAGATGSPGANGATWYSGVGAPEVGVGANNDFYLRTSNEDVYKKVAGAWGVITNLKGEKGEKGATGSTGENGKEGPAASAENNDWKNSVRVATIANITIATALNNADVLDGVTLATNDRVLVKDQTTSKENGIYVVGASPARAGDADAAGELTTGSTIYVEEGTQNGGEILTLVTPGAITIGTTGIAFNRGIEWQAAPLSAQWKNYETAVFAKAEYKKSRDGRVTVRGLVQPAATGQNDVFVLPVGFRPKLQQGFSCAGGQGVGNVIMRVDVLSNGAIHPEATFAATTTAYYLFLDAITFYVD